MPLAIESQLDLVLAFARAPLTIDAYVRTGRSLGLSISPGPAPGDRLLRRRGFSLQLFASISLARVPIASLMEEPDDATTRALGIRVEPRTERLGDHFAHLRAVLCETIGDPAVDGHFEGECFLTKDAHRYRYTSWRGEHALLTLLHDDWGDGHVGEYGTLDLRYSSKAAEAGLPNSVRRELAWPIQE